MKPTFMLAILYCAYHNRYCAFARLLRQSRIVLCCGQVGFAVSRGLASRLSSAPGSAIVVHITRFDVDHVRTCPGKVSKSCGAEQCLQAASRWCTLDLLGLDQYPTKTSRTRICDSGSRQQRW